ncbi:hypothetical protein [Pelagicoccus sp. SDUM812002]|uniref:hypothetical protein n=1 Tax=Pelagicoccus sp. SDUM812002 TaxID=3041266 RepID=UPI00280DEA80|nr:hypothetical protein [Pelagicoccus sp. SDUM812002]MDQ8186626.1 hypothetical protein [Pelagicoccus sp. SDUM812002]
MRTQLIMALETVTLKAPGKSVPWIKRVEQEKDSERAAYYLLKRRKVADPPTKFAGALPQKHWVASVSKFKVHYQNTAEDWRKVRVDLD